MALEPEQAAVKALALLKLWNFPNNYTLGKRLTEIMASSAVVLYCRPVNPHFWFPCPSAQDGGGGLDPGLRHSL